MLARGALRLAGRAAVHRPISRLATPNPMASTNILPSTWVRSYAKKNRLGRENSQQSGVESSTSPPSKSSTAVDASHAAVDANPQPKSTETDSKPSNSRISGEEKSSELSEQEKQTQFNQLPDLTQGIPSAFEFEQATKERNELITSEQPSRSGRKKGELPASAYVSSSERKRLLFAKYMYIFMLATGVGSVILLGRDWENEEEINKHPEAPNGISLGAWWKRFSARSTDWLTYYQDPSHDKLLPDPEPSFERPYTLVLSLEDLLVHSEWSREHGWRMAKRPGVDYFLRYLSQYYELVLFTSVPFAMGESVMRKLDPYHFIMWPLFREATKYKDGEWVKDLSYLNRDLSKVIIIDTNHKHVSTQPENAIILPPWKGEVHDSELVGLIPFLEYIHTMQFPDVRRVLKSFDDKHIPTEFARREAIARREFEKQIKAGKKGPGTSSGLGFLGSVLGIKTAGVMPDGEENPQEAFAKGKMIQDLARERGQRNYELLEQQIREHGEKWLKEEQEMMDKAQKEAMNNIKSSMFTWFAKPDEPKKT